MLLYQLGESSEWCERDNKNRYALQYEAGTVMDMIIDIIEYINNHW